MDQVVEEREPWGGEEGRGEEETNVTALLGLKFRVSGMWLGVFMGERRQDLVGETSGGVWLVVMRGIVSVHFRVLLVMSRFSFSAFDAVEVLESFR